MRLLLESEGHEVSVCHAGLACIEKARSWRPQLVVVAIGLPDVSGYAVARDVRFGVAAGFDAHMTKGTRAARR